MAMLPAISVSAAAWPALVSIVRADAQVDRHQHQARAMGHRGQERPQRQPRGRDAGQKPGVAPVDQQVDPKRDQQAAAPIVDLALPFDQHQKHCERRKIAAMAIKCPSASAPSAL
jgi:hypothetical protein